MTSHLARLARRAVQPGTGLRLRSPSMFERPTTSPSYDEQLAAPALTASPAHPDVLGPAKTDAPAPALAPALATAPTPAPDARGEEERSANPTLPAPRADAEQASGRVARRAQAMASPPSQRVAPEIALEPAAVEREDPTETGAQPAERTLSATAVQPLRRRASQLAESGGDAPQPPGPDRRLTRSDHPDDRVPRSPVHVASEPAVFPRLQPGPRPDEGRRPQVTVNIGRIEVLPPRAPEAKPPPLASPERSTTRAPSLADYLRDRSRR